ncbi:hypothetical protein [Agrobacterium cavarae]|uniref:hypothetical protein n=1 Tax=Agrobacterium cavarae TaxID=2528239 RepID=UPI0028AADD46|nr:hypothetical protein [Agrobacterium cavarae]
MPDLHFARWPAGSSFSTEEEQFCSQFTNRYLDPTRPTMRFLYVQYQWKLHEANLVRAASEVPPLRGVSIRSFHRRIAMLSPELVAMCRFGRNRRR